MHTDYKECGVFTVTSYHNSMNGVMEGHFSRGIQ